MDNNVRYSKEHREKAKKENLRLCTVETTWPGGKRSMTFQGFVGDEFAELLEKLVVEQMKKKKV